MEGVEMERYQCKQKAATIGQGKQGHGAASRQSGLTVMQACPGGVCVARPQRKEVYSATQVRPGPLTSAPTKARPGSPGTSMWRYRYSPSACTSSAWRTSGSCRNLVGGREGGKEGGRGRRGEHTKGQRKLRHDNMST